MEAVDLKELEALVKSHEQRIQKQEERLNNQSERLNDHEQRLSKHKEEIQELKDFDRKKHERLVNLEGSFARLEETVTKENEETRLTMRQQTDRLFKIVEQAMGYQENRTVQEHELKMTKLNTWSTVFLKISGGLVGLFSAGGLIYMFIENLFLK